jgi:hypothetical protein
MCIDFKQRAFWVLEENGPMPPDLIGRGVVTVTKNLENA